MSLALYFGRGAFLKSTFYSWDAKSYFSVKGRKPWNHETRKKNFKILFKRLTLSPTTSETSSEGPSQTYVCQKAHSMWCNWPSTPSCRLQTSNSTQNILPPYNHCTSSYTHPLVPFCLKSRSLILKGTGYTWETTQTVTEKLISGHLETLSLLGNLTLVGQGSFPKGQS